MSNFTYIKVTFTQGLNCDAYQEVDAGLNVCRYCDMDGNTLILPEVTQSNVIDPNPPFPSWGT